MLVLEENESDKLGDGIRSEEFLNQFIGRSGTVTIGRGRNAVDGVSQATKTSKGITDGVNQAIAYYEDVTKGGGAS